MRGGACIMREGCGIDAPDSEELAQLGFKLRVGTALEPDLLVTIQGRPHAFLLVDERRLGATPVAAAAAQLASRLSSLQQNFRAVYLLAPAGYGYNLTADVAARHPDITAVTYAPGAAALAAVRTVQALTATPEEGGLDPQELEAQRLAAVLDEAALTATLQAVPGATDGGDMVE
ncbi:hypothetical protein HYH03_002714 [Edaphochlamys debaryana]|uniref:Uncharacterized protein n=1 Tax=Edaphochlamys debaryana TaxID=47281 RepID=A0A835YE00_9CHLO|nr:hypothetical protein HYH03_002714 [Edaphochlamys debaryana]|eukprot:KAG2499131.1 hypothetical protein HYH03_002714 [Edaphochlamys debaryana]